MKRLSILLAGAALCSLPVASAYADCREDLASLKADGTTTASVASSDPGGMSGSADASASAPGTTTNFETGKTTGAAATGTDQQAGQISKDGSLAPLENSGDADKSASASGAGKQDGTSGAMSNDQSPASAQGMTSNSSESASAGNVSKDGQTMPMASGQGKGEPDVAMSGQDAGAQQSGDKTAAASSGQGTGSDDSGSRQMAAASGGGYDQAIQRAQSALDSGDEAACMAAVEEARAMQGGQNSSN
ncbi:hypothetical protein [Jiella avicenniae]|uniref:Uncharacterized protein n=1 Tax=Jiella avicenniae TaxID=2907202 RepID=A0A9X1NWX8_9HYPH|nr:hypothetical protein [Jiella avicenniae]MCE7027082.1 hypothetical protein [Jiella avicenniae]